MWIKRATYDGLMKMALEANGTAQALERQVTTQKITMDWLMVRLTQSEHERAQLIQRYMGISITTPSFEPVPVTPRDAGGTPLGLGDTISFADVGDEEAKRQGLDWDEQGRVTDSGGKVIS